MHRAIGLKNRKIQTNQTNGFGFQLEDIIAHKNREVVGAVKIKKQYIHFNIHIKRLLNNCHQIQNLNHENTSTPHRPIVGYFRP